MSWAAEHVVGVAQGAPEDIMADLRANFAGECTEVGMYLAMARVAHREGYPEIGLYWEKAAYEEAEHAAKFAELLGETGTIFQHQKYRKRVLKPKTAQPQARPIWQSAQRLLTMQFTTLFMKWRVTKPVTARLSQAFLNKGSANKRLVIIRRVSRYAEYIFRMTKLGTE